MNRRTVLIAEDEPEVSGALEKSLSEAGYEAVVASDGYSALSKAKVMMPDLILLDVMIRGMHGLEVKNRLNKEEATVNIPVIFLTDKATLDDKLKGFELKADDYITKPFEFTELLARIDVISSRRKKYEHIFMTDALTGLNNISVFKKNFTAFFNVARRYKRDFSIAVIDINDFKPVNDTYGHATGDEVLKKLADVMRQVFREPDILIRYGGDEFVVLFPETNEKQASDAVKRFKEKIAQSAVHSPNSNKDLFFSVSAGVAAFNRELKREIELFDRADKNMYLDKKRQKEAKLHAAKLVKTPLTRSGKKYNHTKWYDYENCLKKFPDKR